MLKSLDCFSGSDDITYFPYYKMKWLFIYRIIFLNFVHALALLSTIFVFVKAVVVFRLGRWWRLKEAKNGLYIIPLKRQQPEQEEVNGENNGE